MKTFISTVLLLITLIGCQAPEKNLNLESFKDFPPEIDGCSCYFSTNQSDFESGVYLYMDNYFDLAFIKIDGELITFKKTISGDSETGKWVNDNYLLSLTKTEQSTVDETIQYSGFLTLKKDGMTILTKEGLVGECGC